jgi:hypothetical protein
MNEEKVRILASLGSTKDPVLLQRTLDLAIR